MIVDLAMNWAVDVDFSVCILFIGVWVYGEMLFVIGFGGHIQILSPSTTVHFISHSVVCS